MRGAVHSAFPIRRRLGVKNPHFKVKTYPVGRLKYFVIWPHHGSRTWNRTRWWPTRRNLLNIKGLYNRKTAIAGKEDPRSPADLLAPVPYLLLRSDRCSFPQAR